MAQKPAPAPVAAAKASAPTPAAASSASPPAAAAAPAAASVSAAPSASAAAFTPAATASSPSSPSGENQLETAWTFYFDKKLSREQQASQAAAGFTNYAQNLQQVGMFTTVQGFWRHYAYMQSPDAIPKEHNVYLFRDNLMPAWETFPQGGSWIIKVRKHNGVINRLWEELCFAAVGEWFADPDVVGITLSTRAKDDNLAVWTRGPGMNESVGEKLKEILNLDESTQVEYKQFRSAIQDNSSFRNAKAFTYAPAQ